MRLGPLRSFACAMTLAYACNIPPPDHTLPVRDPNKACALIHFSNCPDPEPVTQGEEAVEDAGVVVDAGAAVDAATEPAPTQ